MRESLRPGGGWLLRLALLVLTAAPAWAGEAETQVLQIINQARVAMGCPALMSNPALTAAAQVQSNDMAAKDFFGHVGKDGHRFTYRAKAQGYQYRLIGENIAAGQKTAQEVARDWLQSPPHRRNILNCHFLETGIALTYQADDRPIDGNPVPLYSYWTQVFGLSK